MEARPKQLRFYETADGKSPFQEWMGGLIDLPIHGIILTRLDRVERGNFGDWRQVGEGVSELRIDVGPGYRVYFGQDGDQVILLGGGIKKSQPADIVTA